jgi:hypothetical protein
VDAKFARLVVARCQYTPPLASAADGNRFAGKFGFIANLNGGIETIHVQMDDGAGHPGN